MRSFLRNLLWLCAIATASAAGSIGWLLLVRRVVGPALLRADNDVAGNYLQTLGTVYAVVLAFVVYVVWSQFNEARAAVQSEANEISDLFRTVHGLGEPTRRRVRSLLTDYVQLVAREEWAAMGRGRSLPAAQAILDQVWAALEAAEPATARAEVIYSEALGRFNDLSDRRSHRLFTARLRLPPLMWTLLLAGAALTVGSMALFGLDTFASHALMTASLAGLIGFILFVVYDLDNPFWGAWRVGPSPLLRAIAEDTPQPAASRDAAA